MDCDDDFKKVDFFFLSTSTHPSQKKNNKQTNKQRENLDIVLIPVVSEKNYTILFKILKIFAEVFPFKCS